MIRIFGVVFVFCLLVLADTGCSKKKPVVAAVPAEPSVPATAEPASSPGAAPGASGETAPATPLSPTMQRAMEKSGVTTAVAQGDQAYEAWFKKYHLDLNDPKMLSADPDGDGFTNEEEFLAGTDPLDPNSHPGVKQSMKMKEYTKVEVPFVLRSVQGESAQIESTDGGEKRVETVKAGQTLHNSTFHVAKVQSKRTQDKDGNPVDASHVMLENSSSHERVDLVKDLPARSTASYAVLTSADGAKTITVHQGDTFSWPNEPGATYVVKDLRDQQVILEQVETKQMWTVRKQ